MMREVDFPWTAPSRHPVRAALPSRSITVYARPNSQTAKTKRNKMGGRHGELDRGGAAAFSSFVRNLARHERTPLQRLDGRFHVFAATVTVVAGRGRFFRWGSLSLWASTAMPV